MARLTYGAGLRLMECCRVRVKDVDFARNQGAIRQGKGGKDRPVMLPRAVRDDLARLLTWREQLHDRDLLGRTTRSSAGMGGARASVRAPRLVHGGLQGL